MATPINLNALIAAVDASEGVKASATTMITGFADIVKTAIDAALAADDAADEGSITAANEAIDAATQKMLASDTKLAAAIANHSTPPVV